METTTASRYLNEYLIPALRASANQFDGPGNNNLVTDLRAVANALEVQVSAVKNIKRAVDTEEKASAADLHHAAEMRDSLNRTTHVIERINRLVAMDENSPVGVNVNDLENLNIIRAGLVTAFKNTSRGSSIEKQ